MKNKDRSVCRAMRPLYSGWVDCELELTTASIEHLGTCEACRDFVAFAQSTPALLQAAPAPPLVQNAHAGWQLLAAGLLGFASVAPALHWLDRARESSQTPRSSPTEMALAVHALRQSSLSPSSPSLTHPVQALHTLTKKR